MNEPTTHSAMQQQAKPQSQFSLKALARQMELIAALESKVKGIPVDQDFIANTRATAMGIFRLVVMGEIKKGKSSFINALTGYRNLVPVHSDVATSTIYKIHYGAEVRYTVYFREDTNREKLSITAAEVDDYGTESGNPENMKGVDFIRVEAPSSILKDGLVIVDTPGVGGLFKKHREITFRHAPKADAVFFVTDSVESPISADEVKFLKELRQITPNVYFVQTKSSQVDADARKARMTNNLEILRSGVGIPDKDINYFIVDSATKLEADANRDPRDLEDSGFGPLMTFMNNTLRRNQARLVGAAAMSRSVSKLLPIQQLLAERKHILDADTDEKRAALDREAADFQNKIKEWETKDKPDLLNDFREKITQLGRMAKEELAPMRPGGRILADSIQVIQEAEDVDSVRLLANEAESNISAITSSIYLEISEKMKTGVERLFSDFGRNAILSVEGKSDLKVFESNTEEIWLNTGELRRIAERQVGDGVFDDLRTSVYGGMAGGAIAGVVGGLLGSFIPVVGTIIGSWAGMTIAGCWGGATAMGIKGKKELEQYKRETCGALAQAFGSAYQSTSDRITDLVQDLQTEASRMVQKMVSEATVNLSKTRDDLMQRKKKSQSEIATSGKDLDAMIKEEAAIRASLQALQKALNSPF